MRTGCEFEPTIFAEPPWSAASAAIVLAEDPVACCAPSAPGFRYLLEVALAQDALTQWALAHDGARPEPDEAVAAVVDYALGCSPFEPSSWSSRTLRLF